MQMRDGSAGHEGRVDEIILVGQLYTSVKLPQYQVLICFCAVDFKLVMFSRRLLKNTLRVGAFCFKHPLLIYQQSERFSSSRVILSSSDFS